MNLSKSQHKLIDLFLTTKTRAKVLRRKKTNTGYEFYEHMRDTSPIDFPQNEEEFAIKVHEKKPDAPLSPIYINLRNLPQELIDKIAQVLAEVALEEQPDVCTGIPNTAVAFAKSYSQISNIPFVDMYEKSGTSTSRKLLPKPNAEAGNKKKLLIIDDVISQGNSKFEALGVAKELGYTILGFIVLIDRSQGGADTLEKMGVKLYRAMTIQQILEYLATQNKIPPERVQAIQSYLKG